MKRGACLFKSVMDFLFPSRCVSCGVFVGWNRHFLCSECLAGIEPANNSCPVCGVRAGEGECPVCSGRKFYPSRNICLFEYGGAVKDVIHALKFRKLKSVYRNLIPFADNALACLRGRIDMVTYVPMNRKKERERGYNQARLLASAIAGRQGLPCVPLLKERSSAETQRELDYTERFINVIDRYEVINHKKIADSRILIVDDVFTTGATINECARKLLCSGAGDVFSLAAARSDLKKLEII